MVCRSGPSPWVAWSLPSLFVTWVCSSLSPSPLDPHSVSIASLALPLKQLAFTGVAFAVPCRRGSLEEEGEEDNNEKEKREEYEQCLRKTMIEGCPPFHAMPEKEVPKAYVENERPQFKASSKVYAHGLKELIEECWVKEPHRRPTFGQVIERLENISSHLASEKRWEDCTSRCFMNLRALFGNRTNPGSRSSRLMT